MPKQPARLDSLAPLVLDSVQAENTRRVYARHLKKFFEWWGRENPGPFSRATVQRYLRSVQRKGRSATFNQTLSALRKLAEEALANGILDAEIAAGIIGIKNMKREGTREGTWLTIDQARDLIASVDTSTLAGARDRVLLALLLECGMRREEAATVTVEQVQERDGRCCIVDVLGKGNKRRTVAVPVHAALRIAEWIERAGLANGALLRAVNKADRLEGDTGITTAAMYKRVRMRAKAIGLEVRPHDLRRTFAELALEGDAGLRQIQHALGHGSIRTTEVYLGRRQNLRNAACDHIDLEKKKPDK